MPEGEIRPVKPLTALGAEAPPATVLSERDQLSGRLEMKGDGRLMGSFEGEIECAGELLIGSEARVDAQIRALHVTISGVVTGNLLARGRLKITATGSLHGDAEVAALVVQEGGVHYGMLRVHPDGVPEDPLALPAPPQESQAGPPTLGLEPAASGVAPASRPIAASVNRVRKMWGEFF